MKARIRGLLILLILTINSFAQSHSVVQISPAGAIGTCEVSVAINPTNPNNIIGTSHMNGLPGGGRVNNATYVTTDGGKTWKTMPTQNPKSLVQGDDSIAFGSDGTAYHAYMSFDGIRVPRPKRAVGGMWVETSKDGGRSWNEAVPAIEHINSVTPFEDKPYVVTNNIANSSYKNQVYMAWTRFDVYGSKAPDCYSHIYFTKSDDGGKTFMPSIRISDSLGDCVDGDNTMEGAIVAPGVKGEIFVVWAGPKGLYFDQSSDGGWTFGADKIISELPGGWDMEIAGIGRANGMPVTKVDSSNSPYRGTLYVNWIDERNGDPDVFLMASKDGGASWSQPVRVNDDKVKNGKAQFFTWMAVDPIDGALNIVFYDRRDLPGTKTGVTLARSIDGGKTFVNYKIQQPPFECNTGVFFGDYNGIDAYNGLVVPIYTHFVGDRELAVSVALFKFKPGTQQQVN
ncbi:MAG: exo-alpha-sialidase [Acidobacteria bacterium]|nr:exo-alpha-sialidase [Acidobacteriota bacterium]